MKIPGLDSLRRIFQEKTVETSVKKSPDRGIEPREWDHIEHEKEVEGSDPLYDKPIKDVLAKELAKIELGNNIVIVGSGTRPVDWLLTPHTEGHEDRRIAAVDYRFLDHVLVDEHVGTFRMDLRDAGGNTENPEKAVAFVDALKRIADFFHIDTRQINWRNVIEASDLSSLQQVDSMIFSDVLNYVDYRTVLSFASLFLKESGRMVVINRVEKGIKEARHADRPKRERDVSNYLRDDLHLQIERAEFLRFVPGRIPREQDRLERQHSEWHEPESDFFQSLGSSPAQERNFIVAIKRSESNHQKS